jgi:uncharacterized protein with HEPN domain
VSEGQSTAFEREWRFYLDDMIGFAEKVLSYTHGVGRADFERGGLVYDATLRNLELLGEAASHIPEEVRSEAVYPLADDCRHPQPAGARVSRHR